MRLFALLALSAVLVPWVQCAPLADSDAKLADEFFVWRAKTAPYTNDDIPRMDRPFGVRRDWSRVAVEQRRADLAAFEARWRKLEDPGASVAHQVDHRLLGSAIARVHWELDILKQWQRDPNFYLEQTLAPMVEALTLPGPYDEASSREILARLDAVPGLIQQAEATLQAPPAPFARLAIDSLAGIRGKFQQVAATLPSQTTIPAADWQASADRAAAALEGYRSWLEQSLPALPAFPRAREVRVVSAERSTHSLHAGTVAGSGRARSEPRGGVRSARSESQSRCASSDDGGDPR